MSETQNTDWDKALQFLNKELGPTSFIAQEAFTEKILKMGDSMGLDRNKKYSKEQLEFLRVVHPQLCKAIRGFFISRGTNLDETKERWFGDFAFTSFSYDGQYYASVSYFPSRNDKIAVISYNLKSEKVSRFTGNLVEIWTTIEIEKLDFAGDFQ